MAVNRPTTDFPSQNSNRLVEYIAVVMFVGLSDNLRINLWTIVLIEPLTKVL